MENNDPIRDFNPDAGAPIPVAEAAGWAANYRNEALTEAEVAGRKRINAYYFGNKLLATIQSQEGCVGLRFYMGVEKTKDEKGKRDEPQLLVVGVDKNGHDIVPRLGADVQRLGADGIVKDMSIKCSSVCDASSPLT